MPAPSTSPGSERVLLVQRSSAPDGSAHSGLLLANGLREAGWEVHVAFGHDGAMVERYETAGHATHVVRHDNWLRRERTHQFLKDGWLEWRRARAFTALVDDVTPRLVYVNTVVSLAGAVAARRAGLPCIWHLREMFADVGGEMHAPRWARPLVRRLVRAHADRLVANSAATARNLLGHAFDGGEIVPNAVRAAFFEDERTPQEARRHLGLQGSSPLIGVPGTLRPMKGHPFFLKAVAPLLRDRNLRVAVTGEGASDFAERLKATSQSLGIQDQVIFLGWVDDMPGFYRACDLACIPSRAEPFGRTAIEAFAVGTPVVATAVGGLREIVTDETTGLLVPYGHVEALTDALRRLLDTPQLRQKMKQNARKTAAEDYHERVYKRRIRTLVAEVKGRGADTRSENCRQAP